MKVLIVILGFFAQSVYAVCIDGISSHRYSASNADYSVGFTPSANPIPVGKHFDVAFEVCFRSDKSMPVSVKIDADMPAHKHGMNYKPKISRVSKSSDVYLAEGLMFHMPGKWRVTFELAKNDNSTVPTRVSQEISID